MKLRLISSIFIFLSAYSPLAIILAIQDFNFDTWKFEHDLIVFSLLGVAVLSCVVVIVAVNCIKTSSPPVNVIDISNRSGELVNYSIPYMISFFVMDLDNTNLLLSFLFFMLMMFILTLKTHNIFINPILAIVGYNLYEVTYQRNNKQYQDFCLVKSPRLMVNEQCRMIEVSEKLFIITERNPKV